MSITLTLGWWMIPAFLPTVVLTILSYLWRMDLIGDMSRLFAGLAVVSFFCALLVRYL